MTRWVELGAVLAAYFYQRMKSSAEAFVSTSGAEKSRAAVIADLIKARLTALVLLTTFVGFYLGERGSVNFLLMFHALFGTALVASGAAALNQFLEREHDAKMRRTATRPLPSGRMQPATAAIFGGLCSVVGLVYLAVLVNPLTAVLGAVTSISYLFIYTPLKRVTWLNTLVGAIPGALPPLMGWTASRNELSGEGWALFAILAFWQIPHFMAIAWLYREEYAKAGFVMLPNVDANGSRTAQHSVSNTIALLLASLCPFAFGLNGKIYLVAALVLGLGYLICAIRFAQQLDARRARQLFLASIIYLPLLIAALVGNKLN